MVGRIGPPVCGCVYSSATPSCGSAGASRRPFSDCHVRAHEYRSSGEDRGRSFTHVGDVVDALLKLVAEPKAIGQVVNIGNIQEVTILQLAERVRELSGSKSNIKFVPYEEAYESGFEDMPRRVPSDSAAKVASSPSEY